MNETTIVGRKFINCTPHPIKLDNGVVLDGDVFCAKKLTASPIEKEVNKICNDETKECIVFVTTSFSPNEEGKKLVEEAKEKGDYLIGSMIAAQAYGYPVVSPITTPETSRLPPDQRIVQSKKWNVFW